MDDTMVLGRPAVSPLALDADQHTIPQTILLHLAPGAAIFLAFAGLARLLAPLGLPTLLIFLLTIPLALVPVELGLMLYLGRKRNGRLSLDGIVRYREPIAWKHLLWLVPLFFVLTVGLLAGVSSLSGPIYGLFGWWPAWLGLDVDLSAHGKGLWLLTWVALFVLGGLVGPFVEELYFRGFLLPRLSRFGAWAAPIETTLFGIYHLWTPWQIFERAIGMLPVTWFAHYRRSIYLPVIVHCAINSILAIPMLLQILAL